MFYVFAYFAFKKHCINNKFRLAHYIYESKKCQVNFYFPVFLDTSYEFRYAQLG